MSIYEWISRKARVQGNENRWKANRIGEQGEMGMGKHFVITFVGDTSLGDWYLNRPNKEAIRERLETAPDSFFEGVNPLLRNSNHLILNLETVLARDPQIYLEDKQYPNWDDPARTINVLKNLGVTAAGLANNHTMDFGPRIMKQTRDLLIQHGIEPIGAGNNLAEASAPVTITLQGEQETRNLYVLAGMRAGKRYREKYQFFAEAAKPGICALDVRRITGQIESIKKKDPQGLIVLFPHWQGMDYQWASTSERIQDLCRSAIQAGADYVIGHGTHMLNHVQVLGASVIVYSVGNFVYNSAGRYQKMQAPPCSLVVQLHVTEAPGQWKEELRMYPILTDNRRTGYSVRGANEEEVSALLNQETYPAFNRGRLESEMNMELQVKHDGSAHYLVAANNHKSIDHANNPTQSNRVQEMIRKLNELVPPDEPANEYAEETFSTINQLKDGFHQKGYAGTVLDKYLKVAIGTETVYFRETESTYTSLVGYRLGKDEQMTRNLLKEARLPVVNGQCFPQSEKLEALHYAMTMPAAVVKPVDGSSGRGITEGITDEKEFSAAWENARSAASGRIRVEEQFNDGMEARYLVVGGRCVGVVLKIPPNVVGNGKDTIEALIAQKNEKRRQNPYLGRNLIAMDEQREAIIKQQGYELSSIPPVNERVMIDWMSEFSAGAESAEITERVHSTYRKVAEKAVQLIPGLDIAGVDIIATDHCQKAEEGAYVIAGINTRPGIGAHHYPVHGPSGNVAACIVDHTIQRALHHMKFSRETEPVSRDAVKLLVTGKLKGTGYRKWVKKQAGKMNIRGYCEKRGKGKVLIVAAGTRQQALEKFIKKCQKGPSKARIGDISIAAGPEPVGEGFFIKRRKKRKAATPS
jgi:D-alanine-D-alanine ligase-like ATP-grasp enzyme/acylphosphatase